MLALKIALRYLFALRKASIGQVLSILSFTGILLGSMSMLIVLSAFNGFEVLLRNLYHFQDPDLQIVASRSKSFELDSGTIFKIKSTSGVADAFEVIKDKAAMRYGDGQMVVEVFGVSSRFLPVARLDTVLQAGKFSFQSDSMPAALVSVGIKQALNITLNNTFEFIQLIYPKKTKLLQTGATTIFNKLNIRAGGILGLDQNRIYIPIETLRPLMNKPLGMSELHIYLHENSDADEVKKQLVQILGAEFQVMTEDEQHADLFKIMKIEKLFVFLALGFVILISSFNLFVSSSMLVINKKTDIRILSAMGMESTKIRNIIQNSGFLVTFFGLAFGLLSGTAICFLQMKFGIVPLGMTTTIIQAYPIDIQWMDYLVILCWVAFSGFIALFNPGQRAAKLSTGFKHI